MQLNVFILTSDNVFFLLLKAYIASRSSEINCIKILNHSDMHEIDNTPIDIILVDGKMINISPLELIYILRYEMKIVSPIWLFSEIQTNLYLDKAIELGANKIIRKPFNPINLAEIIVESIFKNNQDANEN